MYAKIQNGAVTSYPYSLSQMRSDFPNTSFPPDDQIQPADIAEFGVLPVVNEPQPTYDALTHKLSETMDIQAGVVVQGWAVLPTSTAEREAYIGLLIARIDADVDAITDAVVGNRGVEYVEAEAQARAYQQAGYTGTVPSMAQAWVDARAIEGLSWTAQQASDDILATAAAWRGAVDLIRTHRLAAKARVRVAGTSTAIDSAMANWAGFVAAVRAQLNI